MEWLYNELWSILKPHISKCIDKIRIKRKLKKITRKLSNQILSEFKNEVYYNEFDKYLSVNKIVSNFIQNSISTGVHDSQDIDSFVNIRIDHFITGNPRFLAYRSSIIGMLKKLFVLIFDELNTIDNEDLKHVVLNLIQINFIHKITKSRLPFHFCNSIYIGNAVSETYFLLFLGF